MLECHYPELKSLKLPCFSLDLILKAFHKLPSLKTKRRTGSDKTYSNFAKNFFFPNQPTWMKVLRYDCITWQLKKPFPYQKQLAAKQYFIGQKLYFENTKVHIYPSSEGRNFIHHGTMMYMVIVHEC